MRPSFLVQDSTKLALKEIAKKNSLVIYCGAGVTRDRTGLGWNELVTGIFDKVQERNDRISESDGKLQSIINEQGISPAHKASVVFAIGAQGKQKENVFLRPLLRDLLYKDHGWSSGRLLENIADLAISVALQGEKISIITTNYDDYIDQQISQFIEVYYPQETDAPVPGVRIITYRDNDTQEEPVVVAKNGAGTINIYHIHGRVDSKGKASGDLVFSEESYSRTRARTVKFLSHHFNDEKSFLSLGASLDDAPLIEAFFEASQTSKWSGFPQVKYAIVSPGGQSTDDERESLLRFSEIRGKHLGIDILTSDNHAQVAQFVEEITNCKILHRSGALEKYDLGSNYAGALREWWKEWSNNPFSKNHEEHHRRIHHSLRKTKDFLASVNQLPSDEFLRLEMWMRLDPSVEVDIGNLSLFANSAGPLIDTSVMRHEKICSNSNVASVRAFTDGKPIIRRLDDLGHQIHSTRWKSFFCVPIYWDVPFDENQALTLRSVPVGVATLSSNYPKDGHVSSFENDRLTNDNYLELIDILSSAGQSIAHV